MRQERPHPANQQVHLLDEEQAGGTIHTHATAEYEVLQTKEQGGGGEGGMMGMEVASREVGSSNLDGGVC